jgi:hypothetical protein
MYKNMHLFELAKPVELTLALSPVHYLPLRVMILLSLRRDALSSSLQMALDYSSPPEGGCHLNLAIPTAVAHAELVVNCIVVWLVLA